MHTAFVILWSFCPVICLCFSKGSLLIWNKFLEWKVTVVNRFWRSSIVSRVYDGLFIMKMLMIGECLLSAFMKKLIIVHVIFRAYSYVLIGIANRGHITYIIFQNKIAHITNLWSYLPEWPIALWVLRWI